MPFTFEVLMTLRSRDFKDVQPLNMPDMFITFDVLSPLRFRDGKDAQP